LAVVTAALGCAAAAAQVGSEADNGGQPRPYRVECGAAPTSAAEARSAPAIAALPGSVAVAVCRVDLATYVGWRVFNAQCATCHAADALGSSFAPDLTLRMRGMTQRTFFAALDNGYLGPADPAPPRGRHPDVARYYEELWAYLFARASGDLPAGDLERLPVAVGAGE
jgi:mono/diheme cytochrome c family protein